jgi:hypothetical protein
MKRKIKGLTYTPTGEIGYRVGMKWFGPNVVVMQMKFRVTGSLNYFGSYGNPQMYDYDEYRDITPDELIEYIRNNK